MQGHILSGPLRPRVRRVPALSRGTPNCARNFKECWRLKGQHIRKSLRSKEGPILHPAHNPKVVSSNLTPATMGA
jgi:hypothetical protein